MKAVPVKTTKREFFRSYLELLSPILDLNSRERDVFAELLYHNDKYKEHSDSIRSKLLFDYDTKTEICDKLEISKHFLHNILFKLRTMGYINNRLISPKYTTLINRKNKYLLYSFIEEDDRQDAE